MKLYPVSLVTVTVIVVVLCQEAVVPQSPDEDLFNIQCGNMAPLNYDPVPINLEHFDCPYKLEVQTSPVVPGDLVNITLKSVFKYMPFKAFMIQVRDANDTVLGTFLPPCERQRNSEYHQAINCTNGSEMNVSLRRSRVQSGDCAYVDSDTCFEMFEIPSCNREPNGT